jgi:hypothetical protein
MLRTALAIVGFQAIAFPIWKASQRDAFRVVIHGTTPERLLPQIPDAYPALRRLLTTALTTGASSAELPAGETDFTSYTRDIKPSSIDGVESYTLTLEAPLRTVTLGGQLSRARKWITVSACDVDPKP